MRKPNPTRKPKSPPFPVGTRLRYCGDNYVAVSSSATGPKVLIKAPGIVVTIEKVVPGTQGTGRQLRDEDGPMFYEDDGEPILDSTRDGYSVYSVADGTGRRHGRCIDRKSMREWQVIKD